MSDDAIFMVRGAELLPMVNTPYESEALLQTLLSDFPDLVAGGQVDPDAPRRWVLVGREIGVPDKEGGSGRWSLDHLFLDQDGIPTVVEVKRSTDTRLRREVVGQMLDYAANGIQYWPIDSLRSRFEAGYEHPEEVISELTSDAFQYEAFWAQVEENLRSRRIRMVWVADVIPTELRTIIEYLNEELHHGEALAVEIKQYVGEGVQALVPRVIGMTATQRVKKKTRTPDFEENLARAGSATRRIADSFWRLGETTEYNTLPTRTGLKVTFADSGKTAMLLYPQWDTVEFYLGAIFDSGLGEEATQLNGELSRIAGEDLTDRHPSLPTEPLLDHWGDFIERVLPVYRDARLEASRLRSRSAVQKP